MHNASLDSLESSTSSDAETGVVFTSSNTNPDADLVDYAVALSRRRIRRIRDEEPIRFSTPVARPVAPQARRSLGWPDQWRAQNWEEMREFIDAEKAY